MKKGINYWAFPTHNNGTPITGVEALDKATELGFDTLEFTVDGVGAITLDITEKEAVQLKKEAEIRGIGLPTLAAGLAWGVSPTHPDAAVREQATSNSKKQIEIAAWLGCKTILYIPGMVSACFVGNFPPQPYNLVENWAKESLSAVLPTAEKFNIQIGVENVWNRFLISPTEMAKFIDSFNSPLVGSYFDVGNVMLFGHPQHWIKILGSRIFAIHMKDFRVEVGNLNGFVDLLSGDVPFRDVMQACKDIGYIGPYTAEYVPATLGAAEKAIVALKLIENM